MGQNAVPGCIIESHKSLRKWKDKAVKKIGEVLCIGDS